MFVIKSVIDGHYTRYLYGSMWCCWWESNIQHASLFETQDAAIRALMGAKPEVLCAGALSIVPVKRTTVYVMPAGVTSIKLWVTSFTDKNKGYIVRLNSTRETCTCPDYKYRRAETGGQCKHIKHVLSELNLSAKQVLVLI